MKKVNALLISIFVILLLPLVALPMPAWAADWFVRPTGQAYGAGNGASYENAWSGLDKVKWFTVDGTGVQAGDTLWIGGNFGAQGGPGSIFAATGLTIKANGTAQNPITIRGDVSTLNPSYEDGVVYRGNNRYPHGSGGWTGGWTHVGYGVYKHYHIGSCGWVYAANPATPGDLKSFANRRACAGTAPTLQELQSFQPGDFWQHSSGGDFYVKPLAGFDPDPDNDDYLTLHMGPVFAFFERQEQVGAPPVFKGHSYIIVKNITCYGGGVNFVSSNNITLDNVKFYNTYQAATLYYNSNNINFKNCLIDGAGNGIYTLHYALFGGYPFDGPSNNLLVENCTIKNIRPEKMGAGAPDCHGVGIQGGNGHIIRHNYFENCSTAVTAYIDPAYTEPFNMEVYGNFATRIWRWGSGIDPVVGSGHGCAYDVHGAGGSSPSITYSIHHNIAVDVENAGIRVKSYATNPPSVRPRIFNNIIRKANIGIYTGGTVAIDVRNNIVTDPYDFGRGLPLVFMYAYSYFLPFAQWQFTSDYNLFYPNVDSGNWFYWADSLGGYKCISFDTWKTKIGNQEIHSQGADPLYLNQSGTLGTASDFKASQYSPAILSGIDVGLTTDFEGSPIIPVGSSVDMGAYQISSPAPPLLNPLCTYSLSPTEKNFSGAGGTGSIQVTSVSNCSWTATANYSWIAITTGTGGIGNGQVMFSVAPNPTPTLRSGVITVAGQQFSVAQAGSTLFKGTRKNR